MDNENTTTTTTETTTTAAAPEAAPAREIRLSLTGTGSLPSQAGKAGRPRQRGRAVVRVAPGQEISAGEMRVALARELELRVGDVVQYTWEKGQTEGALTFICAKIDANEQREYLASAE